MARESEENKANGWLVRLLRASGSIHSIRVQAPVRPSNSSSSTSTAQSGTPKRKGKRKRARRACLRGPAAAPPRPHRQQGTRATTAGFSPKNATTSSANANTSLFWCKLEPWMDTEYAPHLMRLEAAVPSQRPAPRNISISGTTGAMSNANNAGTAC
ncbi:hypothetical protein C8R44DRAFT_873442 [Mycena epipterygia]|nr:hypothetical protein C8R44DRAFT_873442 [Mycena epipterygia]